MQTDSNDQTQKQQDEQRNEEIRRKINRKNDVNVYNSNKKQAMPIKKVVNPFDKEKNKDRTVEAPKTKNKIIETIGKNRFAELLNKFSGNGYQNEEKANPDVKQYQISNNINQKIESLLNNNNKTEVKQSTVLDDISQLRKKKLTTRNKEFLDDTNEKEEEDDYDCDLDSDDLDLGDDKPEHNNPAHTENTMANSHNNSPDL